MPRRPSLLRLVLGGGAFLAGSLFLSTAEAQTLSFVQQGGIARGNQEHSGESEILDSQINRRDCDENDYFDFTVVPSMPLPGINYDIEVWASESASTNCADPGMQTPGAGVCRQVVPRITDTYNIKVFVRDIISQAWGSWDGGATADVCESDYDRPVDRVLHFFVINNGTEAGTPLQYPVQYDLLGPAPPGSINVGIGQNALVVSWNESSDGSQVYKYRIYAEPVSATGAGGAGADPDAGAAGAGEPTGCTSSVLTPGEPVPTGTKVRGEATNSAKKAEAGGLTNGVTYAVGVASVDSFLNSGNLSSLDCASPEPVTGFFEAYRQAGGGAGGGYCSVGASPSRLLAGGVAFAALGLVLRRLRARTSTASDRGET